MQSVGTCWRVAFAIYADADTAAAEARSIDAVDRSADDVNRGVYKNLHLPTLPYQQMCRNLRASLSILRVRFISISRVGLERLLGNRSNRRYEQS